MNTYPIELRHIFISPGHNYFGKAKDGPGTHPTHDVEQVEARTGLGLVGDRFFAVPAHFDAQVTFVASEVFDALVQEFGLSGVSPVLMRRNIVTAGVPLNQLIDHEFEICQSETCLKFAGRKACNPCAWMDAAIAPGGWKFLRGRGGLRAKILSDGQLRRGPAILCTDAVLDLRNITEPIARPKLP